LRVLFVSDLHLHPSRPATARLFHDFLAGPAMSARALYILGDLFDAWAGDDDLEDPFNAAVCADLRALSDSGVAVFLLHGNRDFLLGEGFAAAAGLNIIADGTVVDVAGTPTLLLHGDTLCTEDAEYQAFRANIRGAQWRGEFLALPLTARKAEIERLRSRSESEKRVKPLALMDANTTAVEKAFVEHDVARMIHGHVHRQAHHRHTTAGRACERWVLPDWDASGAALACDETGCRWITAA
jgi:UDP-2,3-diacylglucosamine hydrolase